MTGGKPQRPALGAAPKLAIDFGPLLIFFLVNLLAPVEPLQKVFVATGAFMAATIAAMLCSRLFTGSVSAMLWFNGAMVMVFGGLTLWLHDATFIKVKPTIYYAMLAGILFFGLWTGRPVLKAVLGAAYPGLTERGWTLLSRNWAWFFVVMAIANELVWRNAGAGAAGTDRWVDYKLFVVLPATLLFAACNIPMLLRNGMAEEGAAGAADDEIGQTPPVG